MSSDPMTFIIDWLGQNNLIYCVPFRMINLKIMGFGLIVRLVYLDVTGCCSCFLSN